MNSGIAFPDLIANGMEESDRHFFDAISIGFPWRMADHDTKISYGLDVQVVSLTLQGIWRGSCDCRMSRQWAHP